MRTAADGGGHSGIPLLPVYGAIRLVVIGDLLFLASQVIRVCQFSDFIGNGFPQSLSQKSGKAWHRARIEPRRFVEAMFGIHQIPRDSSLAFRIYWGVTSMSASPLLVPG